MNKMTRRIFLRASTGFGLALLLAGCRGAPGGAGELPAALKLLEGDPFGWQPEEEPRIFTRETLFDLMNGQSDAFFVYGFQQVAVQRFKDGQGAPLIVSIYQVDSPDSAYGLFSANRDPQLAELGSQGSQTVGRRVSFWQDRLMVQIVALDEVDHAGLLAAGQALSAALPGGGETPALVRGLPADGLADDPWPVYFHEELSIQDRVFLGAENVMGLGQDTNGVLAQYTLGGRPAWLLLVEYPDEDRAEAGLRALESAGMENYTAGERAGRRVAAVFDAADPAAAQALAQSALKE